MATNIEKKCKFLRHGEDFPLSALIWGGAETALFGILGGLSP